MNKKLTTLGAAMLTIFALRAGAQSNNGGRSAAPPKQTTSSSNAGADTTEKRVEKYLRNLYAWGPAFEVVVGMPKPSPIADLLQVPVTIAMGGQFSNAIVYVSKDGTYLVRGEIADMAADPFAEIRSKLHVGNSPSIGPENAKVTLFEFADLECPSCRQLDRILRDFLPKHPEIRLVFKHFPLTDIHPWAMTAAIASQCAYQQDPKAFWKLHDAIFDAQDLINPTNVWDKMQDLATQQGLNAEAFKSCMSNPATAQEVEQITQEGREVNISGTPTTFVNGRRIVGPDELQLEQDVEFETR